MATKNIEVNYSTNTLFWTPDIFFNIYILNEIFWEYIVGIYDTITQIKNIETVQIQNYQSNHYLK